MATELREETWERLAREGRIEEAVMEYVREWDWMTFVELQRRFEPYCETKGQDRLEYSGLNVVLWDGLSPGFAGVLESLVHRRKLFIYPACWLRYLIDGGTLKLPVVKKWRRGVV